MRLLSGAVLIALVQILGRVLVIMPDALLRMVSLFVGYLIYLLAGKRRKAALSNLYHAYPERSAAWRARTLRESCYQLVEVGLFVIVSPQMSERRLRKTFSVSDEFKEYWRQESVAKDGAPGPVVALVPHASLFEALALLPMLNDAPLPVATVYRPLKQRAVEDWVLRTRQRFGMRMISRKQGLGATSHFLAEGGVVAVLFDQNAGDVGLLTTLYGRLCSTSELPGILAARHAANVYVVWPQRTGFWRATICGEFLGKAPEKPSELCFRSNLWLENALRNNEALCAQWLWMHARWRTQSDPKRRFKISQRRNALEEEVAWRGLDALPRGTHFWVRLPNWLGDVIMVLPLLRAMRKGRPDGFFTVLAAPHFIPLLEALGVADRCLPLPKKGKPGYWKTFKQWSGLYPHTQVLFTNSQRGDLESWLIDAPQRFGIARRGKARPLLTHSWRLPDDLDEASIHQTLLWQRFLGHFGLEAEPDFSPLTLTLEAEAFPFGIAEGAAASAIGDAAPLRGKVVGLVCGTENSPEKRWPVTRWRELINALVQRGARCVLFGTRNDAAITGQVAEGFPATQVLDRAGKTDLPSYAAELKLCDLLVTNDTGGMHLANALGVPVLVVFGPTNPVRTGPIFAAPSVCLQPPGCPAQGGAPIEGVTTEAVVAEAQRLLLGS